MPRAGPDRNDSAPNSNFSEKDLGKDRSQLWENFIVMERVEHLSYSARLHGYEFKSKKSPKLPTGRLAETCPGANECVIRFENYLGCVSSTT